MKHRMFQNVPKQKLDDQNIELEQPCLLSIFSKHYINSKCYFELA